MARAQRQLDFLHPLVPTVHLVGATAISMLFLQPVVVGLSFLAALSCSFVVRGARATLRGLIWQLPLVALIGLANPLFSASGSTMLLKLGPVVVYLESLVFGVCAGALLVSTVLWLECLSALVGQDGLFALGAFAFPTATLAVSMCARLVPQLVTRAREVSEAERACTAASGDANPVGHAVDTSTALMTWALEDSLVCADAMRARGWGIEARRTSFRPRRVGARDALALAVSVALLVAAGFLAWVAWSQWAFYPVMPALVAWWGYLPVAVMFFLPACAVALGRVLWR